MKNLSEMIGREVQIYPTDTLSKFGTVHQITDNGALFEVTRSKDPEFTVGETRFVSFSARLSFRLLPKQPSL